MILLHKTMQQGMAAVLGLLLCFSLCRGKFIFQGEVHERALRTIDLIYQEDFNGAFQEARRIIRKYPDDPAGYFFCAVVLDCRMEFEQSSRYENEFYQYCDNAIIKGEIILDKNPGNACPLFFIGGAEGLKGKFETRNERWITAFRYGWKGVSILRKLQKEHPDIFDVNYGIGTYDYWRSAMTKVMRWLPGVTDKRKEGIAALYASKNNGVYTRIASAVNLIEIMFNEKRYQEMLDIVEEFTAKYPDCLLFSWGKARAYYGLGQFDQAAEVFNGILLRIVSQQQYTNYNLVLCHYWLARSYHAMGKGAQCAEEYEHMKGLSLEDESSRRLTKHFSEIEALVKRLRWP